MVNNSTNINKTNNQLSPQTIEREKKTMTLEIRNPDPGLGQEQKCDGMKLINGVPTFPSTIQV